MNRTANPRDCYNDEPHEGTFQTAATDDIDILQIQKIDIGRLWTWPFPDTCKHSDIVNILG